MKISLPISNDNMEVISTNVSDDTPLWDNLTSTPTYYPFYYEGFKYQHEGKIYMNTGDPITIPVFDYQKYLDGGYSLGDIVWNNRILKFKNGTAPQAPGDYDNPAPTESWDENLWISRYAKLQDVPTEYGAIKTNRNSAITGSKFTSNGLHYYECTSTVIYHWELSSAFDISGIGGIGTETDSYNPGVTNIVDIFMHPSGTRLYYATSNGTGTNVFYEVDLTTAYKVNTTNEGTKIAKTISSSLIYEITSIYFKEDGTQFYLGGSVDLGGGNSGPDVMNFPMTTAWDINTYGGTLNRLYNEFYSWWNNGQYNNHKCKSFAFNTAGTLLYAYITRADGANFIYQITLPTAWDMTSPTSPLGDYLNFKRIEEPVVTILKVSNGFWTCSGSTMRHYATVNGDDILEAMHSPFNHCFNWNISWSNYTFEYRIKTVAGVTTSEFNMYDELLRREYYDSSIYYSEPVNIYSVLTNTSTDIPAKTDDYWNGWVGFTFVCDDTGLYVRTHLTDLAMEIVDSGDIALYTVEEPTEIDGFTYLEVSNEHKPFDGKNYTTAVFQSEMKYTIRATEPFDTLALGNVKATHIYAEFKDATGAVITTIDSDVDTTRDTHGHLPLWHTTIIVYSTEVMYEGSSVDLTLTISNDYNNIPRDVGLATLLMGISAEAGFTNLTLKNEYKDFSNFEQDIWGNVDYTERAKVSRYSGTVDLPITNYDMTDRLMTSLGKNLVIVNGSDDGSCGCDSYNIFNATQKIGRFMSFTQQTQIKDGDMGVVATYSFTLEEIV